MAELASGGVIPGYGRGDDSVPLFLGCDYVLPPAAAAVLSAGVDSATHAGMAAAT